MAGPIRLDQALQSAAQKLRAVSENPYLDAQVLLSHVLNRERSWLLAYPEVQLDERAIQEFDRLVARAAEGEALPYLIGERWFYGRSFSVEPAVLIPRPETELLVETALDYLRANPDRRRAVDIGTGSGCIAVTLCAEAPDLQMVAIDRSHQAVRIARRNAETHGVEHLVNFMMGDLLNAISGAFDLICANLPYIPSDRLSSLEVAKREPHIALDGGGEGLIFISRLLQDAGRCLAPGGCLILEIDESQGDRVIELMKRLHPDWPAAVHKDLAGLDRVLVVEREA
ncbi:MAG: peptide chain release factor N(5)-glutamine methyltransferase [Anaerolineales bacterium]|nr:peptide chain release factor N(5)-glutamine methyltransferase [Anaerolineales bacterium]